jgi:heterodisulfide reductase subunit D
MRLPLKRVEELSRRHNLGEARVPANAARLNAACPVARVNDGFSPERLAMLAVENPAELVEGPLIWQCLTCGLCRELSGGAVEMSRFVRELRQLAASRGYRGSEARGGAALAGTAHGGLLIGAQRLQAMGQGGAGAEAPRTGVRAAESGPAAWLDGCAEVSEGEGEYLYWAGGAAFFQAVMPELDPAAVRSARGALRLLNRLGIRPVLLPGCPFSGHDLLWTGEADAFARLAERNLRAIRRTGARQVIVSSPQDYHTLAVEYPRHAGELGFEVRHITELLCEGLSSLRFGRWDRVVTYHDPCRLGRGMGVYEAPRRLLHAIPGVRVVEMESSRERSQCCGTSCWTGCSRYSKLMQIRRLQEARATGAQTLVTACWECELHFRCATRPGAWQQVTMEVADLVEVAAARVQE